MAEEIILTAEETTGMPIARVQVVDKETGTATDVDVRSCARAVTCDEGKTVQEHVNKLYEHIGDQTVHMTAEEKAGLETTQGAQEKADEALAAAKEYADAKDVEVLSAAGAAADGKISTAMEEAASDATTKANAAMLAAVEAAAADATEKAAAAEQAAKEASRPATWFPTAAQTGAYSKDETDTLLANKANASVTYLPDATDFNSILKTGSYKVFTGLNSPIGGEGDAKAYMVIVMAEDENALTQLAITYYQAEQGNRTFTRTKVLGSWSEWKELAATNYAVNKAGDYMTGDLLLGLTDGIQGKVGAFYDSFNDTNNQFIETHNPSNNSGIRLHLVSNVNDPNVYADAILWKYLNGTYTFFGNVLHTGNAQTLGFPKIAIGSYVGTGTYSSANPNSLTFDFEPKIVFIVSDGSNLFWPGVAFVRGQGYSGGFGAMGTTTSDQKIYLTWSGNTVSWYSNWSNDNTANGYQQMNRANVTYRYVALG